MSSEREKIDLRVNPTQVDLSRKLTVVAHLIGRVERFPAYSKEHAQEMVHDMLNGGVHTHESVGDESVDTFFPVHMLKWVEVREELRPSPHYLPLVHEKIH